MALALAPAHPPTLVLPPVPATAAPAATPSATSSQQQGANEGLQRVDQLNATAAKVPITSLVEHSPKYRQQLQQFLTAGGQQTSER